MISYINTEFTLQLKYEKRFNSVMTNNDYDTKKVLFRKKQTLKIQYIKLIK